MTLVNVHVARDRALMAADTISCRRSDGSIICGPDGTPLEDSKLIALPHASCVFSLLGALALRHHLQARASSFRNIDEVIMHIPSLLRSALHLFGLAGSTPAAGAGGHTAVFAGWSPSRDRMIAVDFQASNDFEPVVLGSGNSEGYWRNPGIDLDGLYPDTPAKMLEFARRQVAHCQAQDPSAPIGGRLMVAEVTRDSIVMRMVGELGLPRSFAVAALASTLAACGGSDEGAEAMQLQPGAATVSQYASTPSGTLGSASGIVSAHINTLAYVNDTSAALNVEIHHSVKGVMTTAGGGTGATWFAFVWDISGGGGAAADTSSNEQTFENDFSNVQVVSVPAGRTLTAYLDAYASRTGGTSVTNNYRSANSSIAAIKR